MNKSESITKLAAALAKAQGEVDNAAKNAENPHFRSKYADLAEVINTVRPVLAKHGLAVTQWPGFNAETGEVTLQVLLTHESGEWVEHHASCPIGKRDAQGVGSGTTYLRRYTLAALAGVAQEDDDGNAASQPAPKAASHADAKAKKEVLAKLAHAAAQGTEAYKAAYSALPVEQRRMVAAADKATFKATCEAADKQEAA